MVWRQVGALCVPVVFGAVNDIILLIPLLNLALGVNLDFSLEFQALSDFETLDFFINGLTFSGDQALDKYQLLIERIVDQFSLLDFLALLFSFVDQFPSADLPSFIHPDDWEGGNDQQ